MRGIGAFLGGIVRGDDDGIVNGCHLSRESVVSNWETPRRFHVTVIGTRSSQGPLLDFTGWATLVSLSHGGLQNFRKAKGWLLTGYRDNESSRRAESSNFNYRIDAHYLAPKSDQCCGLKVQTSPSSRALLNMAKWCLDRPDHRAQIGVGQRYILVW